MNNENQSNSQDDALHRKIQKLETSRSTLAQVIVAFIIGLVNINIGVMAAFPIVVIGRTFDTGKDVISLNLEESSWYGSLPYLVLPLSSFLCGSMQHCVGRKHGAALPPSTSYLSEVIETRLRGRVMASMPTCVGVGSLILYSMDLLLDWKLNAILCTVIPTISIILLIPLPESPSWLINKGRKMEARKALSWLRGWVKLEYVDLEFHQICRPHEEFILSDSEKVPRDVIKQGNDNLLQRIMEPATLRPLIFMNCFSFFLVAVSSHGARTYVFNMFESMGNSKTSVGIGIGVIAIFGAFTCTLVIKSVGKKRISLISMLLCSLISIFIGIYMAYGEDLAVPWLLYLLYFLFYYMMTIGNIPVPWILLGEIFPQRTKSCCIALTTTIMNIYIFASIKAYVYMRDMFGGNHGAFIVNGIIGLFGCWYSIYYFPETEGKSLAEIEEYFSKEYKAINKQNSAS